jgi:hypothetical protein
MPTAAARASREALDVPAARRFSVHGEAEAPGRAQLVEGLGFEDAALRFAEEFHPSADADAAVSLLVEDCETGERQCFTIDLATGDAEAGA